MPKDTALRKVRKGTKSCVECRQRKIKCIWSETAPGQPPAEVCNNCEARGRPCVSQVYSSATTDAIRLTSRERIGKLEGMIQNLQASIQRLESRLSLEPLDEAPYSDVQPAASRDEYSESEASDCSPVHAPAHLQQLFDNGLLGTPKPDPMSSPGKASSPGSFKAARRALQDLLPPKSDIAIMQKYVGIWVVMMQSVFPTSFVGESSLDMISRYEAMQSDDAHPTTLANYLCPLAITVLHVPENAVRDELKGLKDGQRYVRKVSDAIEQYIFGEDHMIASLAGLEMAIMFLRLQMLQGRIRKVWVGLRRIVAMAEMLDIPRAATTHPRSGVFGERRQTAIDLWNCIVSIDRVTSLMFNLPVGTAAHKVPVPDGVMVNGTVHLPSVLLRMSASAVAVLEIDEMVAAQRPLHEISERVMLADQEWRALADLTPARWWHSPPLSADAMILYWYQYIGVRLHLQLALRNDEHNTLAYSHMRCIEACRNMAIRYPQLRTAMPTEFFAGRLYDVQVLTPGIFLLHSYYKPGSAVQATPESPAMLVRGILEVTDRIGDKTGGAFAKQVGTAIRSVIDILEGSTKGKPRALTLQIPILGKIHVGSRPSPATATRPTLPADPNMPIGNDYSNTLTDDDFALANSLDYFMEMSEDYSFSPSDLPDPDVMSLGGFEMME
ncbi:hypothetical protein AMS68_005413 [Peltaster fructicola]|uniref:Zn(2)-C6 fungal-type domain-containing protein n=1 Tax=Peltaster fructicola TaxID=286661 RepID=A0A6H0XYY6_9PEZI|nr:hypothetical protein AMS68_005413 [Peltaster fructicola]